MFKLQCLATILALMISAAQSWDIAMTTGAQLKFYENQTNVYNESSQFTDLTALAYDAVHNMLLFVDRQNDNASIFSFHIATKKYQSLVRKRVSENIHSIAFDPVNSLLFWTDIQTKSIYSRSLAQGSENSPYGNLWLKMDDEIPAGIAVDSCRGYVYWTNTNPAKPTIERARFNGTERKVIVNTNIFKPVSLTIDQRTKRLYWINKREGIHFSIEGSDLDGSNRLILYIGTEHWPQSLTVSKDSLYWLDLGFKKVWQIPKDPPLNVEPEAPLNVEPEAYVPTAFQNDPFSIVANYHIQDQTEGVPVCESLRSLTQTRVNDSFSVPPEMGLFCVHGHKVKNKLECKCSPGYTGDRCEMSVCHNFCFQGDCSVNDQGQPSCSCTEGVHGDRCEVRVCHGYCLNNGMCSLTEEHKPMCNCATDFEGARCESEKVFTTTTERVIERKISTTPSTTVAASTIAPTVCNCTSNVTKVSMYSSEHVTDEFVPPTSCNEGWDAIRDPIIMVLGIICGLLVLLCVVLFTKILQLKKRPRIKKRIIVNKNVTPMTARPDQCEITIENCCNMNICETPCFEPRSTIRPTLLDSKPGKEEKKNLISNMEYPDDY